MKNKIPDWMKGAEPNRLDWMVYLSMFLLIIVSVIMSLLTTGCGPTGYQIGHAHSELCAGSTITVGSGGAEMQVPATVCVMVLTVDSGNGDTSTVGCSMVVDSPAGSGYLPPPMSHARCSEAPGYRPFRVGLNLNVGEAAVLRPGYAPAGGNGSDGYSGEGPGADSEDRGITIDQPLE